jgi:hypothetical protein
MSEIIPLYEFFRGNAFALQFTADLPAGESFAGAQLFAQLRSADGGLIANLTVEALAPDFRTVRLSAPSAATQLWPLTTRATPARSDLLELRVGQRLNSYPFGLIIMEPNTRPEGI